MSKTLGGVCRLEACNDINLEVKPEVHIREHNNSVDTVAINPSNPNEAITASHDHKIGIWDLKNNKLVKLIDAHKEGVWCAQYNKQGDQYASCGPDTVIKIWNAKTHKVEKELKGHTHSVYWVDFNETGDRLVSCGKNSELMLWDVKKAKCIMSTRKEAKISNCVKIDPTGKWVFTAEKKGWLEA